MALLRRRWAARQAEDVAVHNAVAVADGGGSGRLAAIISAIALALSLYSLWETSLKRADLRVFVPPVIH